MLTKLIIRNFKRFENVEIELGNPVVFIGPNNSGKTTALQALALWEIGLKKWNEKRKGKTAPEKRPGVTINRRDLITTPVPNANLLWRDLHVRDIHRTNGRPETKNVRVELIIEGVTDSKSWQCGLEFDYANEESIYCRPLRLIDEKDSQRMSIPDEAAKVRIAFLPPMSGLASNEIQLVPGTINVRIGEGRTAEVLRNLCYQIIGKDKKDVEKDNKDKEDDGKQKWLKIHNQIYELFKVKLDEPVYISERGEITMTYCDPSGVRLDLSSSGRGLQQTLLLLAYMVANPGTVLLLDEPDAHLEILRQRQIYENLVMFSRESGSQIIVASHSEVILNEAANRDMVVAFIGKPHRIDDRGSQVLKSLKEIGFDQYYHAEQIGWVLYLEGSTDLGILRALAEKLDHPAKELLERPFVHYVANQPQKARDHFYGLREAKPDLVGYALFDHLERQLQSTPHLKEYMWHRREIENYFITPETLMVWAERFVDEPTPGPLFESVERSHRRNTMLACIQDFVPPVALRDLADAWWINTKISDDFLDRLFAAFFQKLQLPNLMNKANYHVLAQFVSVEQIDNEVYQVLDSILETANQAKPIA